MCTSLKLLAHTVLLRVCLKTEKAKKIQFSEIVTQSITHLVTLSYGQSFQSTV